MRTLSLDEARLRIRDGRRNPYTDHELADWPRPDRVLLIERAAHCGGTDKSWVGVVSADDADTLEREGLADGWRRSRQPTA